MPKCQISTIWTLSFILSNALTYYQQSTNRLLFPCQTPTHVLDINSKFET